MSDLPFHSRTGLQAIGVTRRGPVWPVMGASEPSTPPPPSPGPPPPPAPTGPPTPPSPSAPEPPDRGFPENTPIVEMTSEQQAAYWKFHDRRKSDRLRAYGDITPEQALAFRQEAETARREALQPSERALEDARTQGATVAQAAAAASWAPEVAKAVVGGFVTDPAQRDAVLCGINPLAFVKDGRFDTDALVVHLTSLSTAFGGRPGGQPPRQWGQSGSHPPATSGRDQGLAEAKRRGYITD